MQIAHGLIVTNGRRQMKTANEINTNYVLRLHVSSDRLMSVMRLKNYGVQFSIETLKRFHHAAIDQLFEKNVN